MSSLVIKNGTLYDPLRGIYETQDVGIENGVLTTPNVHMKAEIVVDASGCIVLPGLIDYHIHLFSDGSDGGVDADVACLPNGVTTAVDGGSCGEGNYEIFHKYHVTRATTTIRSYLNMSSPGLATARYPENLDPRFFAKDRIRKLFSKYSGELVSLKIRMSRGIVGEGDAAPLQETLGIAAELGCNVVVHFTNPSMPCERIAAMLRPGDVLCHLYHGVGDTILDEGLHVKEGIREARSRGVLLDGCNGRSNFAFSVALPAAEQGFWPDIISSDLTPLTLYKQPVVSLPSIMSKYLNMGLSLREVLDRVTLNPATALGIQKEYATLEPSTVADVAILRVVEREVVFWDTTGAQLRGNKVIVPQMTIKEGIIRYAQTDLRQQLQITP